MKRWLAALAVLASCSGAPPPPQEPPGPLWKGDAPPGAVEVSPEEYVKLLASDTDVEPLDPDAVSREAAQAAADQAEVDALVKARPELAALFGFDPADAGVSWRPGGRDTYLLTLPEQTVAVHGDELAVASVAESMRSVRTVQTQRDLYALFYAGLSEADRAGFPAPQDAPETLPELQALNAQLAGLLGPGAPASAEARPPGWAATAADEQGYLAPLGELSDRSGDGGCGFHGAGLHALADWPLELYETSMKHQAARGTCTSFAVTAGVETLLARDTGAFTNLSEQSFYGHGKGDWYPSPKMYGDGLKIESIDTSKAQHYAFLLESAYAYNRSEARTADNIAMAYAHSCDGVPASRGCTDTNHQYPITCTVTKLGRYCAVVHLGEPARDPAITDPSFYGPGLGTTTSFWNFADAASTHASALALRLALQQGDPVALVIEANHPWWDPTERQKGCYVRYHTGTGPVHALLAVGYVPDSALDDYNQRAPPADRIVSDGDGWVVLKNSWGECYGDHGYVYASLKFVEHWTLSAVRLHSLNVYRPKVTLSGPSTVTAAGDLTLTSTVAPGQALPITREELYDGPVKVAEHAGTGPFVVPVTGADDGDHWFTVKAFATQQYVRGPVERAGLSNRVKVTVAVPVPVSVSLTITRQLPGDPVAFHLTLTADVTGGPATTVAFLQDGVVIATLPGAPQVQHLLTLGVADNGNHTFKARATAAGGSTADSMPVGVFVNLPAGTAPVVQSFSSAPMVLPPDGGTATLSWSVTGATSLSVDHGVGDVTAQTQVAVPVSATTTFTLSATNDAGTATATTTVTVAPACAAGLADCDGSPLTCEADLTSDATCGRCDVSCHTLGCSAGYCRSATLAADGSAWRAAVGGGAVYTMRVDASPPTLYRLIRIPTDGSPEVQFFAEGTFPGGVAADDTYVYWGSTACDDSPCTTPSLPYRILKKAHTAAAADPPTLVTRTAGQPILLALGNGVLWWHTSLLGNGGDVYYRALNAAPSDTGTKANGAQEGIAKNLVVATDAVYWNSGSAIRQLPLSGGLPSASISTVSAAAVDLNGPLYVDGAALYFAQWTGTTGLFRYTQAGGVQQLVTTSDQLNAISAAGASAYFASQYVPRHWYRVPAAGGAAPLEVVDALSAGFDRIAGCDTDFCYGTIAPGISGPLTRLPR